MPSTNKQRKTEDMNTYMKIYRESNLEHMHNLEKTKYYRKRYNLDESFCEKFGEHSGEVYKILTSFKKIKESNASILSPIIDLLNTSVN
jgi:hypothetical protein